MPRGQNNKELAFIERVPASAWNYSCNGEVIKTSKNMKNFNLWVKLHKKYCIDCQQKKLSLTDIRIQTPSGHLKTPNQN